ncbi:LysR family transcriptional regulator [Sporosarcina trichiuri]|uniref:LysR family transcriptional regulator n=1 Tax=Sporosarcina trichiuri TaxID=3056445 RepID=UPI0025B56652|nr:LysR family transcriptional regulator [Sporosarcina sp. 0.2-SM1T-5]WJY26376.1 LysR family transcriptional regulator [Sporosarcina sp. 0.2-SM1T-5]
MNLHRLRCFTQVVEEGSVSKAAKKLNMAQPPLSMLIRKLEEELDVTLFERYKKRLLVTEVGTLLYHRAKEILSMSDNIQQEIEGFGNGIKGTVRIGTSTSASITLIPSILEDIQRQQLDITLEVREGKYTDILRELRNNEIDIGLVRNTSLADDLEIVELVKEPLLLALPPSHHLLTKSSITLQDLRYESFLMQRTTLGHNISDVILEACQATGFIPAISYWGTTSLPIVLMVKKGAGIAFIPQSFRQLHDDMELPPLLKLPSPDLYSYQSLIMLRDRFKSPAVQKVVELTKHMTDRLST